MAKRHYVVFKHLTGSLKMIPGVHNREDLCPRLIQDVARVNGKERPYFKLDESFTPKILLQDEELDVKLTEKEKKHPQSVQNKILERRTEEADFRIRANDALRDSLRYFEAQGEIKVLDWDYVADDESAEVKGSVINELSPIALADFEDRGIPVPEHLKRAAATMPATVTEKSGVQVKQALSKKIKTEE